MSTHSHFGEELILPRNPCPGYSRSAGNVITENKEEQILEVTVTNFTIYIPQFRVHSYIFKWYAIGYVETDGY